MATYEQLDQLSQPSPAILAKVRSGIGTAALAIIYEDPGTPNHENRLAWAKDVSERFGARSGDAERLMWFLAQNATYQAQGDAMPDTDIQVFVNGYLSFLIPGQS